MARDLAIDLGTANTLVYMKGRGIVLNEPAQYCIKRTLHQRLDARGGHGAGSAQGRLRRNGACRPPLVRMRPGNTAMGKAGQLPHRLGALKLARFRVGSTAA